jgi:dihydroxyacetone kinase-like protein
VHLDSARMGGEMEIGIGIRGEPGHQRVKLRSAEEILEMIVEPSLWTFPSSLGTKSSCS